MTTIKILILDTETNGLPKNRFAPPSEYNAYPAILQLSWAVYTVSPTTKTCESEYGIRTLQPPRVGEIAPLKCINSALWCEPLQHRDVGLTLDASIPWDTGAAKIHGISEIEARHGIPATQALLDLATVMNTVDVVIAHNLAFDKPVIRAAAYAAASQSTTTTAALLRHLWPTHVHELCTMRSLRDTMQLPATANQRKYADLGPYKAPTLNELYTWLHGHPYDISGAVMHTSRGDVECLAHCIRTMVSNGILTIQSDRSLGIRSSES